MPEKLQKQLAEGNTAEAITMGEEYLRKKPYEADSWKVRELVRQADYKVAIAKDTVSSYEYFENKYTTYEEQTVFETVEKKPEPSSNTSKPAKKAKKTKKAIKKTEAPDTTISESSPESTTETISKTMRVPSRRNIPEDLTERKSKAYYRDVTLSAGTAAAAKEFQKTFPLSSLSKDAEQLELKLAWDEAVKVNSILTWKEFRAAYSNHPQVTDALLKESLLAWEAASVIGTETALDAFAAEYPESGYVTAANEKICQSAWLSAQTANSIESYKTFIKSYGRCKVQVQAARENEERLAWNKALTTGTTESFEQFADEYQESKLLPQALGKSCEAAWTKADSLGTSLAMRQFQQKYERCSTQISLAKLKDEQLSWNEALKTDTWETYRDFIDAFPASVNSIEAEKLRQKLYDYAGPVGDDEFTTSVTSTDDRNPDKIRLYVQVSDKDGKVVGGLNRSNFTVFENACPADLINFEGMETERPVDIVVILDATGSMGKEIEGVRVAATQFAENLKMRNRGTRLALVSFGDEVRKTHDFTTDSRTFQEWVSRIKADGGDDDPENPLGAMEHALQKFSFRPSAQTVFVLVTDTTAHENDRFTQLTVAQISEMLRAQRASLFSISPDIDQYKALVKKTGGRLFDLDKNPDFTNLFEEIATMTAKQYLVTYKGTSCTLETPERIARVRARQDYLWQASAKVESREVAAIVADKANPAVSYMATRDAGLFRTTDGGRTWVVIGRDLGERAFEDISWLTSDGGTLLARAVGGRSYMSYDSGATWKIVDRFSNGRIQTVYDTLSKKLFATDGNILMTSQDNGATWNELALAEFAGGPISIAPDRDGKGVIVLGKNDIARRSRDGGITWKTVAISVPEPGNNLGNYRLQHHSRLKNIMFLSRRGGNMYRSVDSGKTWNRLVPTYSGSTVEVDSWRDLIVDESSRGWLLYPSARGLLASSDAGSSWFTIAEGIGVGEKGTSAVSIGSDGKIMLAGASGDLYNLNPIADREMISGNIYFDTGSAVLKPGLFGYLNNLAEYLKKNTSKQVNIEGHTDDKGDDDLNMRLSLQRANSVKTYLMNMGVASERVSTTGSGKQKPIVLNESDVNRAKNRRVEIIILG
jgi:VWFA-related protein